MYEECLEEIKQIPNKTLIYDYRFLEQKWKFLAPEEENENAKFVPSDIVREAIEGIEAELQEKLSKISLSLLDAELPPLKPINIDPADECELLAEMRNLNVFYQNQRNYNQVYNSVEAGSVAESGRYKDVSSSGSSGAEPPSSSAVGIPGIEASNVIISPEDHGKQKALVSGPQPPSSSRSTSAKAGGVRVRRAAMAHDLSKKIPNHAAAIIITSSAESGERKAETTTENKEPQTLDEQLGKLDIAKSFKKYVLERGLRLPFFLNNVELGEEVKLIRKSSNIKGKPGTKGVVLPSRVDTSKIAVVKGKPVKKGFIKVDFPNRKQENQSPRFNAVM